MRKRLTEIIWLAVLVMLLSIIGALLWSGGIRLYLAPRLIPVVWFGVITLSALSIHQSIATIRGNSSHSRAPRCYAAVFTIPILLMLLAMPNGDTPQTLPKKNTVLSGAPKQAAQSVIETMPPLSQTPGPSATAVPQTEFSPINIAQAQPCVYQKGSCAFDADDDMFENCLYASVEELLGRKITLYGFIYKDSSFPENTIAVARLYITCCVADASLVGYHFKVENPDDFTDQTWVRVTGTAQAFSYENDLYPILTGGTVIKCETPTAEDAYMYP